MRKYIGASAVGHPCNRWVQFSAGFNAGVVFPPNPFKKSLAFALGHTTELVLKKELQVLGWVFEEKSFTCNNFDYPLAGTCDGLVTAVGGELIPSPPPPFILEIKSCKSESFEKVAKAKSLQSYSKQYYGQIQIYMHFLLEQQKKDSLIVFVNKNNGDLHSKMVVYDENYVNSLLERIETLAMNMSCGFLEPTLYGSDEFFPCSVCEYKKFCFER